MARWGMVIDLTRCTGCRACVVACRVENNVPSPTPEDLANGRAISWLEVIAEVSGSYPDTRATFSPRPCMHCDHPPCVKVCPVGATYRNPEGLVTQIYDRCIGCRYCANNCPYTVKYFNWREPTWPEALEDCLSPDVPVRPVGVVEKCTFCHHRLQLARDVARGEGRKLLPGEYLPACAETCPSEAIVFGDLDDPTSRVYELAHSSRATTLMEDLGTEPKVIYLTRWV